MSDQTKVTAVVTMTLADEKYVSSITIADRHVNRGSVKSFEESDFGTVRSLLSCQLGPYILLTDTQPEPFMTAYGIELGTRFSTTRIPHVATTGYMEDALRMFFHPRYDSDRGVLWISRLVGARNDTYTFAVSGDQEPWETRMRRKIGENGAY